jgi:hypothetical protein
MNFGPLFIQTDEARKGETPMEINVESSPAAV